MNKTSLAKKAHLLRLTALSLAEGMRSGSFKSLYRGQGIEFNGVREYLRGDDIRAIDWNVTARMGKPFVKMFEEERELDVFIVLDKSLSMSTGSGRESRIESAVETASLLALACEYNSSPVGCVIFDGKIRFSCAPKSGADHIMYLLSQFEKNLSKRENGSALSSALHGAGKLLKKRTLVMVISDFRTAEWQDSFARLCQKHDVVAVRIADPLDEKLPSIGTVPFKDPETGYREMLPTSSKMFENAWREDNYKRVEKWKKDCLRHGGYPLIINTANDVTLELKKFFNAREQK